MSGDKKDPGDPKDKPADSISAKNRPSGPPEDITNVPALTFSGGHIPELNAETLKSTVTAPSSDEPLSKTKK